MSVYPMLTEISRIGHRQKLLDLESDKEAGPATALPVFGADSDNKLRVSIL
jgi:hypothetical protein